jgi:GMP reductase
MKRTFSYKQIALVPKFGVAATRAECDTSVEFLGKRFALPIIPANMRCSINLKLAEWFRDNDLCYVMHRFCPYDELYCWLSYNQHKLKSLSIGVQRHDYKFVEKVASSSAQIDFLTIDVAHGYSELVRDIIAYIHTLKWNREKPKLIVGNITDRNAAQAVTVWGADAIKVGIGQGHVCTTRLETGFGMPMFSAIQECREATDLPIIADGGISHFGDAAKAIVAGADMVMSGSMFARCIDSPAETHQHAGLAGTYKSWYGSASEANKGSPLYVEGKSVFEETNYLTYELMLQKWKEALQSAISYAGGTNLNALRNCEYVIEV